MSDKKSLFDCIETAQRLKFFRSDLYSCVRSLEKFIFEYNMEYIKSNPALFKLFGYLETLQEIDETIDYCIDVIFRR